jgi:hypothetical protein
MTTWNTGAPLELIRFAGANRLEIASDCLPERGRVEDVPFAVEVAAGGGPWFHAARSVSHAGVTLWAWR